MPEKKKANNFLLRRFERSPIPTLLVHKRRGGEAGLAYLSATRKKKKGEQSIPRSSDCMRECMCMCVSTCEEGCFLGSCTAIKNEGASLGPCSNGRLQINLPAMANRNE